MSKELEAFRKLMERLSNNVTIKEWDLCNKDMQIVEDFIEQALTPPTAEEVCKALSEYYGFEVMYKGLDFFPKERLSCLTCVVAMVDGCIDFADPLPPHLITLIGRFYEGVEG